MSTNFDQQNTSFRLAYEYINESGCHIYLTGKAGTGKTTLLKYVRAHSSKRLAVVAPTGVAAINAGGVTIHSFFGMPLGIFLPEKYTGAYGQGIDQHTLISKTRLSDDKRKIIEQLELLIIDEVSMVRCDLLDAIDVLLRYFRKNPAPFGGVQILMIGDLYQLPPVVRDGEERILATYYNSPFFFDALVMREAGVLTIELKTIYRQSEERFIDLLNKIRHNALSEADYAFLQSRYQFNQDSSADRIILTTHNYRADAINEAELMRLEGELVQYEAEVHGDFNEKQTPAESNLRLKKGAQVMFLRNDMSGRYYNGKLGVIESLNATQITVRDPHSGVLLDLERETWKQIQYIFNRESGQIEEKIIGQFVQYPLRLAWAITIHKSQGLTFDKVIIDAGSSFAPGQVYVALSRCTSLEGIILKSPISPAAIQTDQRLEHSGLKMLPEYILLDRLKVERSTYQAERLKRLLDWRPVYEETLELERLIRMAKTLPNHMEAQQVVESIFQHSRQQMNTMEKFQRELDLLIQRVEGGEDKAWFYERTGKALHYFSTQLYQGLLVPLRELIQTLTGVSRVKKYIKELQQTEADWSTRLRMLQEATYLGRRILDPSLMIQTQPMAPVVHQKKVIKKGESAKQSKALFDEGKSIAEIAVMRNLAMGTIESHLSDFVLQGELPIEKLMDLEKVQEIKQAYEQAERYSTTEIRSILNDKYSHGEIRWAVNHLLFSKEVELK